jgi:hypothetical protein
MAGTGHWNPLRMTAIGMAVVMGLALVTGLVVANWAGAGGGGSGQIRRSAARTTASWPAAPTGAPRAVAGSVVPSSAVIEECNRVAGQQTGPRDATLGVAKGAASGTVVPVAAAADVHGGKGPARAPAARPAPGADPSQSMSPWWPVSELQNWLP